MTSGGASFGNKGKKGWYNFKLYALRGAAVRDFVPNVGAKFGWLLVTTLDPVGPKFGGRIITTLDPVGPKFGVVREGNFCTSGAEVREHPKQKKKGLDTVLVLCYHISGRSIPMTVASRV